jgi:two-component system heavy metal sensor histidine kinase CusS
MPSRTSEPPERPFAASLRTRLTLWNTAVVLVMTVVTLLAVRFVAKSTLYRESDANLGDDLERIVSDLHDLLPDREAVIGSLRRMAESHAERGWFMHLLTSDGATVWKSDNCPAAVAALPPSALDRDSAVMQVGPLRYVRQAIRLPEDHDYHVRVGMHTGALDARLAGLMRLLVPLGLTLSLLTPLAGAWLAGRATRPVADIVRTAERLEPTRLTDRLPVRGTGDELDRMSLTINGLLDRVADLVERQERFVADAAHELRGPLTAVQSTIEVAMARDASPEEYRETLDDVLVATRQLGRVANDLLLLAECHGRPADSGPCDLVAAARQALAMFTGVAEERGIVMAFTGPPRVEVATTAADVHRLVANLLDNAVRFTPAGGRIEIRIESGPASATATLSVADTGVGIPAGDLVHAFERFSKGDPSRSHAADRRSGGLGLAICKALVEAAGGSITIASRPGAGTRVAATFPLAPPARRVGPPHPVSSHAWHEHELTSGPTG